MNIVTSIYLIINIVTKNITGLIDEIMQFFIKNIIYQIVFDQVFSIILITRIEPRQTGFANSR